MMTALTDIPDLETKERFDDVKKNMIYDRRPPAVKYDAGFLGGEVGVMRRECP